MTCNESMSKLFVIHSLPSIMIGGTGDGRRGICYTTAKHDICTVLEGFHDSKATEVALSVNGIKLPVRKYLSYSSLARGMPISWTLNHVPVVKLLNSSPFFLAS